MSLAWKIFFAIFCGRPRRLWQEPLPPGSTHGAAATLATVESARDVASIGFDWHMQNTSESRSLQV
jgi:hypothetical protein